MTFTVPKSNADPGRSADIASRIHTPQIGNIIAKFGDDVMQGGRAIEAKLAADRAGREEQKIQTDMTRDVSALRHQVAGLDDPDALDENWSQGIRAIQASYFGADGGETPGRVPEAMASRLGSYFTELSQGAGADLGKRALELRAAQRVGNVRAVGEELAAVAVEGDDYARAWASSRFDQSVDGLVELGLYAPEVGAEAKRNWRRDVSEARRQSAVQMAAAPEGDDDPADALEARIASDPTALRLVRIEGFVPDRPEAVSTFSGLLDELEAVPAAEREAWLSTRAEAAGQRRRAALPRPDYAAPGPLSPDILRAAALRTLQANRAGRLSADAYARQARLIQEHMETFNV
ncbi:MAG: hypothetical protein KDK11_10235 [Maritimibacter sp.]|nr:hypothetical protein [Maritimibacter sp.]